jgi:hypothetical protein
LGYQKIDSTQTTQKDIPQRGKVTMISKQQTIQKKKKWKEKTENTLTEDQDGTLPVVKLLT